MTMIAHNHINHTIYSYTPWLRGRRLTYRTASSITNPMKKIPISENLKWEFSVILKDFFDNSNNDTYFEEIMSNLRDIPEKESYSV